MPNVMAALPNTGGALCGVVKCLIIPLLWPPCETDADILFCLCGFPSPILSRRRLDVYYTSTHDVVLVRI